MAKNKHLIRNSMKSFYECHTDPTKHEKLEAIRKDVEEKKKEILNIVQNKGNKDEWKRGTLAELIEDFYNQYDSLYAHYDHLNGELKNKVHKQHHEKGNSSSSSDSDLDSDSDSDSDSDHSSNEKGCRNGKTEDEILKATDGLHQELEAAKLEATLLKKKLEAVCSGKETLESSYDAIISKLENTERTVEDLKVKTESLNSEKSNLVGVKEVLNSKQEGSVETEVDLKQMEELIRDKDNLATEKEDAKNLKAEVKKLENEKQNLKLDLDSTKQQTVKLEESMKATEEENKTLSRKISDIADELFRAQSAVEEIKAEYTNSKERLAEREREFSSLQQIHYAYATGTSEQIKALEEQNRSLKLDLDTVMSEKREIEERLEVTVTEAGNRAEEVSELRAQISQVEILLKDREDQISSLLNNMEVNENETKFRIEALTAKVIDCSAGKSQLEDQMAGKSSEASTQIEELKEHISALEHELNTLQVQDREMKLELERKDDDVANYLIQIEGLHEKLSNSDNLLKKCISEKENLAARLKDFELEVEKLESYKACLENESRMRSDEATQLREEIQRLQDRIEELEKAKQMKDESVAELERTIEDLKRDVQAAADEAYISLEKTGINEVQFCLVKQKLRVTEQLLAEKEEEYKIAGKRFREECKLLEDEISKLSVALAATNRAHRRMITNISEHVKNTVAGMESICKKFEEDNKKFSSRIYSMSEEIQILKQCVAEKNVEREKLEEHLRNLTEELQNERKHGLLIRKNLSKLEGEAEKEKGEREKLLAALNELKKTTDELDVLLKKKNEQVIILEDEKREAIRQLCLWNDNLQCRYNKLKNIVAKSSQLCS